MNVCAFVGRLTADVELKKTQNDKSVCSFTLAVKRPGVKDTTDFINFVAWNQSAEYLAKYGHKGSLVEASGKLTSRNYEDKNGSKRKAVEVVADEVSFCGEKRQGERPNVTVDDGFDEIPNDDLPF